MPNNKKKGTSQSDPDKKTIPGNDEKKLDNNFNKIIDYLKGRYEIRKNIVEHRLEYRSKNSDSKEYKELIAENLSCELQSYTTYTKIDSSLATILGSTLYVTEYNPIKKYVDSLPSWNKSEPDYIKNFGSFVTAKDQPWFDLQFKKMIVRNLAAALGFIAFNKQCFVFAGGQQDAGKSTLIRFIPPPLFSRYVSEEVDFLSKDGLIALTENFLIILDEVDKYNKIQAGHIKSYMSKSHVKVRLPYGKRATLQKRIASFIGSTNKPQFLSDPTGNVRWLIMEIESINHDRGGPNGYKAKVDIDLVYAQAYHLLKSGFEYKLTPAETAKSELKNKSFLVETSESGILLNYFKPAKEKDATHGLSLGQMMKFFKTQTSMNLNQARIRNALTAEGFTRKDSHYFSNIKTSLKGIYLVQLVGDTSKELLFKNRLKAN